MATQVGVLSAGGSQGVRAAQGAGAHRMVLRCLWVSVPVPTSAAGKAFPTLTEAWSSGKGAGDGGRYSHPAPSHTDLDGADCEELAASGLRARRSESPPDPSNQPQGGQCLLRPLHLLPLPPTGPLGRTPPNPMALGTGLNPGATRAGPCVSCSGGHGLPGRLPVVIKKQIKSSLNPTL